MSGYDQGSILTPMPSVTGSGTALAGPFVIKPSEAYSSALMTISGLTGETISVETSPDGYWGAPASPTFFRKDWQGNQQIYSTARTNIALQSQTMQTTWVPAGATIAVDATTAPDGTTTADQIKEDGTTGTHLNQLSGITITNATNYTISAFVKSGGRQWIAMGVPAGFTNNPFAYFDLINGVVGNINGSPISTSITAYPNGWFRITLTALSNGVSGNFTIWNASANGTVSYTGDGVSGCYAWGFQVETGTTATSYIPTTTVAVTITDYTLTSNGIITFATAPLAGAVLSFTTPYTVFGTGDGTRKAWSFEGMWGSLTANATKGNGIYQIDLRGAQAFRITKSAGVETATVNMTLKRDALQYKNTAGTWTVT